MLNAEILAPLVVNTEVHPIQGSESLISPTADSMPADTSILGRCGVLSGQLEHLKNLKTLQDERTTFEGRQAAVQNAVAQLEQLWSQWRVLTSHGLPVAVPSEAFLLRDQYAKVLSDFQNDMATLARSSALPLPSLLNGCVAKLRQNLKDSWATYVAQRQRTISEDERLLTVLALVPGFERSVADIRTVKSQLHLYSLSVPTTDVGIANFNQAIEELRAKWGGLKSENLSEAVLNFLRAAGQGGATLDLLSTEVRDWLRARQLEGAFHVVIG